MTYYGSRYKKRRCPGCGSEFHMPAQALCDECKETLKIGRIQQKRLEKMSESDDKILVRLGRNFMPTPTALWPHIGQYTVDDRDFIRAIESVLGESPAEKDAFGFYGSCDEQLYCRNDGYSETSVTFWMGKGKLQGLKTIMLYIKESFQIIGNNGIDHGRNILISLANGGVKELNKATTRRG